MNAVGTMIIDFPRFQILVFSLILPTKFYVFFFIWIYFRNSRLKILINKE